MTDRDADCLNFSKVEQVNANLRADGQNTDFSENNRKYLAEYLAKIPNCKCIVEIGVENNPDKTLTSTATLLNNKDDSTFYFGIDILDRTHLDNPEKNIYTIMTSSENVDEVMSFIRSKGIDKIDFLFIDGWHSINACEWEWNGYTPYLSEKGIVGFHDTNHHPGPQWLLENIDSKVWHVVNHASDPDRDFGIGFTWKK